MPLEYRLTGVSMKSPSSENATMSSKRRRSRAGVIPMIAPWRNTFSPPVRSLWNPAGDLDQRADPAAEPQRPTVGWRMLGEQLEDRRLAGPVRADDAERLPGPTENDTSCTAQNSRALSASGSRFRLNRREVMWGTRSRRLS